MARLLEENGIGIDALETSVRGGAGLPASGGRMMIERLAPELARSLLAPMVAFPSIADSLLRIATAEGLRVIGGWDTSSRPLVKLYLNASDASLNVRARVRRELVSSSDEGPEAPHVVGLNVSERDVEVKLYEQRATLWEDTPPALRDWAAAQATSGFVRSWRLSGERAVPKAWFVGLRGEPAPSSSGAPGPDLASIMEAAPFPPGALTSLGISPPPARWTVYFKALGATAPSWSLDPIACFSDGHSEVGLYLEPMGHAKRAYAQTERWALSYRVREGAPAREEIHRLMAYYLRQVEEHADDPVRHLHSPPEPWHVID